MNYNDALKTLAKQLTPFQIDIMEQIKYWNGRGKSYNFFKKSIYTTYAEYEKPKDIDNQIKWLTETFLINKSTKKSISKTGRYITNTVFTLTEDGKFCLEFLNDFDSLIFENDNTNDLNNELKERINFNKQQERLKRLSSKYNIGYISTQDNKNDEI